jgi:hypothetical protein
MKNASLIWWSWITFAGLILIAVGSPLQRRYFTLKTALLLVNVRKACCSALVRLELGAELIAVSSQLAISRLRLRYLLFKRIIVHKIHRRPAAPSGLSAGRRRGLDQKNGN